MTPHAALMVVGLFVGGADHAPSSDRPASDPMTLNDTEKSFLDVVAAADLAEMELSKVVDARSAKPAVRALARTILDEDTENYRSLFSLCLAKTYATAPQLDERHRALLHRLQAAHSKNGLDRIYIDAVLVDQSDITGTLERISAEAKDSEIAQFASNTLVMVRKHEQMARELSGGSRG